MSRFQVMNEVEVPDQWDDIRRRAEHGERLELAWEGPRGRRVTRAAPAVAVAAAVLVVAAAVGIAVDRRGDDSSVATEPDVATEGDVDPDLPELVCVGGQLAPGSLPAGATADEGAIFPVEPMREATSAVASWSWTVDALEVQFIVPGPPRTDLLGERTEDLAGLDGTLAHLTDPTGERQTANVIARTGLSSPCGWFEVAVAGGTEEQRVAAALEVARGVTWEPLETFSRGGIQDIDTIRAAAVGEAATLVAAPERVEVAATTVLADERLYEVSGVEPIGPAPSTAFVAVVRPAEGMRFVGRDGADSEGGPEDALIHLVLSRSRFQATFSRGFATPEHLETLLGRPLEELDLEWVPALVPAVDPPAN